MKKLVLLIIACLYAIPFAHAKLSAEAILVIRPGNDLSSYSNDELKKHVWDLERAVLQLQQRVFELELNSSHRPTSVISVAPKERYTCYLKAFAKTFSRCCVLAFFQ